MIEDTEEPIIVSNRNKDEPGGCSECHLKSFEQRLQKGQLCTGMPEPDFRSVSAFKKRMRTEYARNRKALKYFLEANPTKPIVQEPDEQRSALKLSSSKIWDLASRMSRSLQQMKWESKLSVLIKEVPIIEEEPPPRIKDFPLTEESVKKHIEKETAEKKEEKLGTVLMLKKKQEDLKRLKEKLTLQKKKHFCHHDERKAEYEKEKMAYLNKLAKEQNINIDVLLRDGDVNFKNYQLEMKKLHTKKVRELEKQSEVIEELLKFEEAIEQKEKKKRRKSPRSTISSLKSKKSITEFRKSGEFELQLERPSTEHLKVVQGTAKLSRANLSKPKLNKAKLSKASLIRAGKSTRATLKSLRRKTVRVYQTPQKLSRAVTPVVTPLGPPESKSQLHPIIVDLIKELIYIWKCISESRITQAEGLQFPKDTRLIVNPSLIHFENFLPHLIYQKTFYIFNPTKDTFHCGYVKVTIEPAAEGIVMFDVWPDLVVRIWPGSKQHFNVYFATKDWERFPNGVEAMVWLWSKADNIPKFYRIAVKILCSRHESNIKVTPAILEFSNVPFWKKDIPMKYLKISNYSELDYIAFVHRKSFPEEDVYVFTEPWVSAFKDIISNEENLKAIPNRISTIRNSFLSTIIVNQTTPYALLQNFENKYDIKTTIGCLIAVNNILAMVIDEVFRPFRIHLSRGVYLKSYTRAKFPIRFIPELVEGDMKHCQDELEISFEGPFLSQEPKTITLTATLAEMPIKITPDVIDMQVTMLGVGVWQTTFQLENITDKFYTVQIKLPKDVRKHFVALPKTVTLRPQRTEEVLLRARIGWDIYEDAASYLDKDIYLLDFPLTLQPSSLPDVPVGVLAVISHPLAITIEPSSINFGYVSTAVTALQEIWVKNHTVVPLHIAFLNIPKWGMIMPEHGICEIGPSQIIRFHFLYSPTSREAGKRGGQAIHTFSLTCTTLERLAATPKTLIPKQEERIQSMRRLLRCEDEQVSTLHDLLKIPVENYLSEIRESDLESDFETLSFLNENLNVITFEERKEAITKLNSRPHLIHQQSKMTTIDEFEDEEALEQEESEISSQTNLKPYITLRCRAMVIDPICELSAQKVILPDTPYGSYSIHWIYIRCPNETNGPGCFCGKFSGKLGLKSNFQAKFEFFSPSEVLEVEPATGTLSFGEKLKIYFILKPELQLGNELKKPRSPKARSKKRSTRRVKFSASSKSRTRTDKSNKAGHIDVETRARLTIFRNMNRESFFARVKCLVQCKIDSEFSEFRYEILSCEVISQFVRPDIVVRTPNETAEIKFPITSVGTRNIEKITVHNTSPEKVYVTRSYFNHSGIFDCYPLQPSPSSHNESTGIPLEPEQYLNLHITFTPINDELMEEYFEIRASQTVIPLKVSGQGAIPNFSLSPQFAFCQMEAFTGSKVEEFIWITNKCGLDLKFEVFNCFQMVTHTNEVLHVSHSNLASSKSTTTSHKSSKNIFKDVNVRPEVLSYIDDLFLESNQPVPIKVEPKILHVPPHKKGMIKITFNPRRSKNIQSSSSIISRMTRGSTDKSKESVYEKQSKNKISDASDIVDKPSVATIEHRATVSTLFTDSKGDQNQEEVNSKLDVSTTPTYYASKVQVVLGRITLVAEWLIIGKVVKIAYKKSAHNI